MKNYAEVLAKGSLFVFLMYFIGTVSGYLLRLYLARNLSIADFGLFYSILAFTGIFVLFRDLGLSSSMVKFIAHYSAKKMHNEVKSVFLTCLYIQLPVATIIMVPIILFSGQISLAYFKTASAAFPLTVLAVTFIVSTFFSIQFILQGIGRIRLYAIVEPARNVLTLACVVFLVPLGVAGVAFSYLAAAVLTLLIIFRSLLNVFPFFSLKSKISLSRTKEIVHFSAPIFLAGAAGTILGYADTVILTYFSSLEAVGLYNAALPTSQLLFVVASSMSIVLLPIISELWTKNEKDVISKIAHMAIKLPLIAILPLIIVLVSFPEIFLRLFFGESYTAASAALQILTINAAFYTLFSVSSAILLGIGKSGLYMKIHLSIAALNLTSNLVLVPLIGLNGAALSAVFSYFFGMILSVFYLEKSITVKLPITSLLKAFVGGLITLFIFFSLKTALDINPWAELLLSAVLGFTFYFIFIFFTKTIERNDIRLLYKMNIRLPRF